MAFADGLQDAENQYAFTVMVKASVKAGETLKCSGVLVSPRLVLTAGHCVCARRKFTGEGRDGESIIDGAACAESAEVVTVLYHPREGEPASPTRIQSRTRHGKVRPHPDLKVLLDAQSRVMSSGADLAVVSLEEQVDGGFSPARLADTEAKAGESVVLVGYGLDPTTDLIQGVRRSGRMKVAEVVAAGSDVALLEAQAGLAFTSGSGAPCLLQEREGPALVGVSSMGLGDRPAFTRVYLHREWVRSEVQRVAAEGARSP
ncbi:trypsin-like serine protease [Hyalangium rubrum]|uniref:Trypsin-like serine protease n=1 Tax=Hyalangium rubrum TaxID=3103134 RepID=A0ABU5GY43_9BACT|nr:trypsin-like serine protease [Hyalangium sp. s54d21]MDY7226098.1 trypsin-like serine protease [Hyalangium sp. s54d21]